MGRPDPESVEVSDELWARYKSAAAALDAIENEIDQCAAFAIARMARGLMSPVKAVG